MCGEGGHAWQMGVHGNGGHARQRGACMVKGGVCGMRHAWRGVCIAGACMAGGMHGRGVCMAVGCAWQERWPLQRTVCILLECILVLIF